MSKHTPGPWSVPHFARTDVRCDCGYVLADGYMGAVATVHRKEDERDDNPPFEEACANARLIAAAPDLLEALKVLLDEYVSLAGSGDCGFWNPEESGFVINARAIIAKAEGRA